MIGAHASVLECAGTPALLLGEAGSWIAKRKVVTFCSSVSWSKGELLQKVTKETKMFESRSEELAKCTQRCQVDSHAGEKRWSTTALQDASRRRKLSDRAFEMRRGWTRASAGPFVRSCSITVKIGAKHVRRPVLMKMTAIERLPETSRS
jgi:hypothetical protein